MLILGIGIGATTLIFSVVNATLLRSLPYRDAGRLTMIWSSFSRTDPSRSGVSVAELKDFQTRSRAFSEVSAFAYKSFTLLGGKEPQQVLGAEVPAGLFHLLGVEPILGRTFSPAEETAGGAHVAVLSEGLWRDLFGADSHILGRKVTLDEEVYQVVGVMPARFKLPLDFGVAEVSRIWVPLPALTDPQTRVFKDLNGFVARLRPAVTLEMAQQDTDRITRELEAQYPEFYAEGGFRATLVPMREDLVSGTRRALLVLLGAVVLVLLIVSANVANLLLIRGERHRQEFAIRAALGATRTQLFAQALSESLVLGLLGGVLGILLAAWGAHIVTGVLPVNVPLIGELNLDLQVLLFALIVTLVTGLAFGLVPAVRASSPELQQSLRAGRRGAAPRQVMRRALVVAELTLAVVLLVGTGLLIRSFVGLHEIPPGLRTRNVLTIGLELPESRYPKVHQVNEFYRTAISRLEALPGVGAVGAVRKLPLVDQIGVWTVVARNRPGGTETELQPEWQCVTAGYFKAMGVPLKRGRLLADSDNEEAPPVVVVNETLAQSYWPGEEPLGKQLKMQGGPRNPWMTVVGVVGDVHHTSLREPPKPTFYLAQPQYDPASSFGAIEDLNLVVHITGEPAAVSESVVATVRALDRDLPILRKLTMERALADSIASQRFIMLLFIFFGVIALLLASLGVYGIMSQTVSERTQEIGVRLALGSAPSRVMTLVVGEALGLTLVGLVLGALAALALTRTITSLIYDVSPVDPVTFAVAALTLAGAALLACYFPARRASRVDPMVALRFE